MRDEVPLRLLLRAGRLGAGAQAAHGSARYREPAEMSEKKPISYGQLLRDPRWQRKRLEILERDQWKCRHCGDADNELQVHHKRYERDKAPWEISEGALVTLCHDCHERVTKHLREAQELLRELTADQLIITIGQMKATLKRRWLHQKLSDLNEQRYAVFRGRIPDDEGAWDNDIRDKSRRLEAIDQEIEQIWDALQASA
jgi:5-methylcytosine-specific restriction endonuclease McrA